MASENCERPQTSIEVVTTDNRYDAVTSLADGKKVILFYDDHYGIEVTYDPRGKTSVVEHLSTYPPYEVDEASASGLDRSFMQVREAANLLIEVRATLTPAGIQDMGGDKKIAETIYDYLRLRAILDEHNEEVSVHA